MDIIKFIANHFYKKQSFVQIYKELLKFDPYKRPFTLDNIDGSFKDPVIFGITEKIYINFHPSMSKRLNKYQESYNETTKLYKFRNIESLQTIYRFFELEFSEEQLQKIVFKIM